MGKKKAAWYWAMLSVTESNKLTERIVWVNDSYCSVLVQAAVLLKTVSS